METIATITDETLQTVDKDATNEQAFFERFATRAVIVNDENQAALLYTAKHGHHKLVGGGIDGDEDWQEALHREAMEETGCTITITKPLGKIIEERNSHNFRQTSYCAIARLDKELGTPALTDDELADGYEVAKWFPFDTAIEMMRNETPLTYLGKFMHKRDLLFLEKAKELIEQE